MKKTLAVLLSVVMLLSLIPLVSLAAWTKEPVITLTASEPDENGSVAVTIHISESDLITGYGLGLEYDSSIYEVDENAGTYETGGRNSKKIGLTLESDDEYFAATNSFQYNHNRLSAADGEVKIFFITDGNNDGLTEKGMEATFFFKVKSGAMPAEVGHSQTAVFKITSQRAGDTLLFKVMSENDDLAPVPTENNEVTVVLPLIVHVDPVMSPIAAQTYTGSAIEPTVELKDGETVVPASEYTLSYASNVHAGTATVTATPKTGSAYIFQNGPVSGQFTINPLTATFDWGTTTLTYSGAEQSVTATVSNLCGSDTATLTLSGNKGTDVGSYNAEVTAIDNADYALPDDGSASQAWSITKADYTGAALSAAAIVPAKGITGKSFQLSELNLPETFKDARIFAAAPQTGAVSVSGISIADDGQSFVYSTAEAEDNDTGSVTVSISSKNWNDVTATLNLTARTLDTDSGFAGVTVSDLDYGQTNAEAASFAKDVTLTDPEGKSIAAELSVKDPDKVNNAGTATVTVVLTVTEEGSYAGITAEKNFDYTVSPKAVAVTWADTALTYTGAAQAPTASAEGVNGETLSLGVSGAQTDAGTDYTAAASIASVTGGNANPANYTLTADTTAFSIAPKATTFTVTLDETTFTENGAEQKPGVTVQDGETKLTEGKDYTLAFAPAESILPGSYTVSATGAGNYVGSSGTAGYSIIGKPGYVSLSLSNGQTALTASYVFQDNGADITGYSVAVAEVDGETVTAIEGSPFDAGTETRYTVENLETGKTYRVTVTATNAVGSTDSEAQEITLSRRSSVPLYPVTVERTEHGSVSANYSFCKAGNTVKLTVSPDEGYELAELTVTDADGKAVEVAEDNSFVMPAAAVTVSAVFQAEGTEPLHFDDVAEDAWYHDSVYWAAGEGVAQGKDEHIFAPEDISSRGELITFLWRAAGKPESTIANPYTDVSESDECYQAVLWATEQGITVGTAEGEFSPHAAVTRAQMVVFIYRAEQAEPVDVENPFTDVEADAYYYDAVLWAVDKGVTVGTSATTFSPNMACTRAHAVTFLYRLYA